MARKRTDVAATMKISDARIKKLIEEATVGAYNESAQLVGFLTMSEDGLALPFTTRVLEVEVLVERIDMTAANEIVAVCRRGRTRQAIPILEPPLPRPVPKGAEWIESYRRWAKGW